MNTSFWLGFWALPLGAIALAIAVLLVFGSWLALEKWAERRFVRQNPKWERDSKTSEEWLVDEAGRPNAAMLVALAPRVTRVRLFFGIHVLIVRGTQHIPRALAIKADYAYGRAINAFGSLNSPVVETATEDA